MPFPPFTTSGPLGAFGTDDLGSTPYGSGVRAFGIDSVTSLNSAQIRVTFTNLIDFSYAPVLSAANYTFNNGLVAHLVAIDSAQSVRITTSAQDLLLYTLTATTARGLDGAMLDPDLDTATFTGTPATRSFFAVAVAKNTVRLIFGSPMTNDSFLTSLASYAITDMNGSAVPIGSIRTEVAISPTTVVLTLGAELTTTETYQITVSGSVTTDAGLSVLPPTATFEWVETAKSFTVPIDFFSGEIQGGLLGAHNGLVFFSPAMEAPVANSVIQVEQVDVCTTAYDTYTIPQKVDPTPLFTYSPARAVSPLGAATVLFAKWPRLTEAQTNVRDVRTETFPTPVSSGATATFNETWDITRVSLLNSTAWKTFDNGAQPPNYFRTAENLTPIPAGGTVVVVLEP